jgi:hypothetical protein
VQQTFALKTLSIPTVLTEEILSYLQPLTPAVPKYLSHETSETRDFFEEWVPWMTGQEEEDISLRQWLFAVQQHFADEKDPTSLDTSFEDVQLGFDEEDGESSPMSMTFQFDDEELRFCIKIREKTASFLATHDGLTINVHSEEKKDETDDIFLSGPTMKSLVSQWLHMTKNGVNPHLDCVQRQTKTIVHTFSCSLHALSIECDTLSQEWEQSNNKDRMHRFITFNAKLQQLAEKLQERRDSILIWSDD